MKKVHRVFFWLVVLSVISCGRSSTHEASIPTCPQSTLNIPQQQIPDGKFITPVGDQLKVGPFPDALILSKDGTKLFVLNSGYGRAWSFWDSTNLSLTSIMQYQSISVIDTTANPITISAQIIPGYGTVGANFLSPSSVNQNTNNLFQSMILNNAGTEAYAAGGGGNDVIRINMQTLSIDYTYTTNEFPVALAISPDDNTLYVAEMLSDTVSAYDVTTGTLVKRINLDNNRVDVYPYALAISKDGKYLFVAEQGTDTVDVIDTSSFTIAHSIPVGSHPEAFALTNDGSTLYVANTNSDTISVISTSAFTTTATIKLAPYTNAPDGSMPVSLALSPDNTKLYVALAGENAVAVITTSTNTIAGRIPTAWYPAAVAVSNDGNTLYVANANGTGAGPNLQGQYIGAMIQGSVSAINLGALTLSLTTQQVDANNCPYAWEQNNNFQWSKLKHVVFIIRENKTYDSYFGDLGRGNGDPALAIYGKTYTPNSHALADRFCLADNFYAEGQSSVQGHQWLKGANSTDLVEKTWLQDYSDRAFFEPIYGMSDIVIPDAGYFFDYLLSLGISFRNYGEFVNPDIPEILNKYTSHVYPWPGFALGIRDTVKAQDFIQELNNYIAQGTLPRFIYIWLPNDHTQETTPGAPTPQSMVADNDAGLGMIIDALTHSPFWKDMVIFVTEDDPQGVMDHVDAMRMYALVISPYAKKGYISSVHYSLTSMFKTTELIFGIKPLSQFDAYANSMADCFTPTADPTPYTAIPMGIPFTYNSMSSPGARISMHLDFTDPDNPEASQEMQALQWLVLKGKAGYKYYMTHKPQINPNDD
ncbi:MAG: bifunctional YncE family protein/alkaline phosphatase family protein [bacterium]